MLLGEALFKNLKARSIGPAVMGGRVSEIAIDPRNPFVFYVGLAHERQRRYVSADLRQTTDALHRGGRGCAL